MPADSSLFDIIALLVTLTAVFGFLNVRYFRLPQTIGVMVIALLVAAGTVLLDRWGMFSVSAQIRSLLNVIPFERTLMHGLLSFLLFAGALHINLPELFKQKTVVLGLSTGGVVLSTLIFAGFARLLFVILGLKISFAYCLLFGAYISPTDPIAVMGILKKAGLPENWKICISGESLFNDGIGVVLFTVILELIEFPQKVTVASVFTVLLQEAAGGILFGLLLGWTVYLLMKKINQHQVEIMLTLALVMGGYTLASRLHTSGPLAIVIAGLFIGNRGRTLAMSANTRRNLDTFWEVLDGMLNAFLFVLIGFEVLLLPFSLQFLMAGFLAFILLVCARFFSVYPMVKLLPSTRKQKGMAAVLTWGGLRGGISVALALTLPAGPAREILLPVTYMIVLTSILLQGLSLPALLRKIQVR